MPDWAAWMRMERSDEPEIAALITQVARYLMQFKYRTTPPCWLSLLGKVGNGKTHCAQRAFDHMVARTDWADMSYLPARIYWPSFVNDLRSGEQYEKLREMAFWPVLFLDDVGAERDKSGFATEQLNTLLGQRVGRWTILTSNLSLEQISRIDPRMADRIVREEGNRYIEVNAEPYRCKR